MNNNNQTQDYKDSQVLLKIVKMISEYVYGTEQHPYTTISGPSIYVSKHNPKYELKLWTIDFEPGMYFTETLWEAFKYYGADDFAEFWLDVEGDFWRDRKIDKNSDGTRSITEKYIPIMLKMINSAQCFSIGNDYIHGPFVGGEEDKKWYWRIEKEDNKDKEIESLSTAFEYFGLQQEADVIKRLIEKK